MTKREWNIYSDHKKIAYVLTESIIINKLSTFCNNYYLIVM